MFEFFGAVGPPPTPPVAHHREGSTCMVHGHKKKKDCRADRVTPAVHLFSSPSNRKNRDGLTWIQRPVASCSRKAQTSARPPTSYPIGTRPPRGWFTTTSAIEKKLRISNQVIAPAVGAGPRQGRQPPRAPTHTLVSAFFTFNCKLRTHAPPYAALPRLPLHTCRNKSRQSLSD